MDSQASQQPSPQPVVDPFEFQEDPIDFEPSSKPSGSSVKQDPNYVPHYQQQQQLQQNQSLGGTQPQQQGFDMEDVVIEEVTDVKEEEIVTEKAQEETLVKSEDVKESKVSVVVIV